MRPIAACVVCVSAVLAASTARAQRLPSEPIALAGGAVTLGGDVSASIGPDDTGFFNFTDYDLSALRLLRLDLTTSIKAGRHLTFLGELRTENLDSLQAFAFYLRIRPWLARRFDIQVGRVPPTFGAFARRDYATSDNPLIGYPLQWQYLTSLRPDALPANADELLRMRGSGWLVKYSIGDQTPDRGVPLASALRWDTGVQIHAANDLVDLTGSVTTGTISNPRVTDDNSGPQVAGRAAFRPVAGLVVGVSAARGPFVSSSAARSAGAAGRDLPQASLGADVEYSRDHYLIRAETIATEWSLPAFVDPLRAAGISIEGRYKLTPALYAAARADHVGFSDVTGSSGKTSWDAPVTRFEVGGGYSIQRNIVVKVTMQYNSRDGGREHTGALPAVQLVYWF